MGGLIYWTVCRPPGWHRWVLRQLLLPAAPYSLPDIFLLPLSSKSPTSASRHFILFSSLQGLQVGLPRCVMAEVVPSLFLPESPQSTLHTVVLSEMNQWSAAGQPYLCSHALLFPPHFRLFEFLGVHLFLPPLKPFLSIFLTSSIRSLHRIWGRGPHFTLW